MRATRPGTSDYTARTVQVAAGNCLESSTMSTDEQAIIELGQQARLARAEAAKLEAEAAVLNAQARLLRAQALSLNGEHVAGWLVKLATAAVVGSVTAVLMLHWLGVK